jgi:hypothetical protein
MTNKQKYYRLMSLVCETLPPRSIDLLSQTGYELPPTVLYQVRNGRAINIAALVALVQIGLPEFQIPEELLPTPAPQPLFS